VPDTPEENDQNYSLEVPPVESDANREQKNRREDKAPLKASEQSTVAVRADHPRQMMADCTECTHEKVNVLCAPARLRQHKHWQQKQRRPDVKKQVAPAVENPKCFSRRGLGHGGNSLRT